MGPWNPPSASARGRWAPSPTGSIHLGNARTALVAWLSIRQRQGDLVWRLEDLDRPRVVPGLAQEQQRDLAWLGLDWDEGPQRGGPFAPYAQSERGARYEEALRRLDRDGLLFPCTVTRRELRNVASAPHGAEGPPYPPSLRPQTVSENWLERLLAATAPDASVRFRVDPREVEWEDLLSGRHRQRVDLEVGDFVLRRRDGVWAYQLAVVVDDIAMQIDEVVRGADLMSSTGRQILLFEALGADPPRFAHVPLMVDPSGEKLSKRHDHFTVASLRAAGIHPEVVVGYLALTLGLLEAIEPCTPAQLVDAFDWRRLQVEPTVVPPDLLPTLLGR